MKEEAVFHGLVLSGIWTLILFASGKKPYHEAIEWRAQAITYMDDNGNQSDGSKKYRREKIYPELRL